MKPKSLLIVVAVPTLFTSCAAGRIDRTEDRFDRREDYRDRLIHTGPADRREDYWDRRENVNDKLRGRRALYR